MGDLVTRAGFSTGGLAQLDIRTQYRTGESDPIESFYLPCLRHSNAFDRAVGYFRSSIYLVVGSGIVEFARKGGNIRLVCSPSLASEDVDSMRDGYALRHAAERSLLRDVEALLSADATSYRAKVLATLIGCGCLDIKVALRPEASGLYHEKIGIFRDELGQAVSFLGSANETWNGWHEQGNHEAVEVFCSWATSVDAERICRHKEYFEALWSSRVSGLEVIDFPSVAKERLLAARFGGLEDIAPESIQTPKPRARLPMEHQVRALEAWRDMGCRGIFEHATGSGKTFLALTAVKEHVSKGLPALIVVPSTLLLKQWAEEVRDEIPDAVLLVTGGGDSRWNQHSRLRSMTDSSVNGGPRIIVSTMHTAASEKFRKSLTSGEHLMLVGDEVHQVGSAFLSNLLEIDSGPRIGLSATPSRYGDADGTNKIFAYFGGVVPPAVTLADAIHSGRLVPYEYYPHPIRLDANEAEEWRDLSRQVGLEIARASSGTSVVVTDYARMLLIKRSRIAKKASAKVALAAEVISREFRQGERWLIYCEDTEQLGIVIEELRKFGNSPMEYHSAMQGDAAATLQWFRSSGGVLVSIKCLDEGVDIPAADHALILASSQNPRQFIQRRGRVLRKAPNKAKAVIHDAIVIPHSVEKEPEQVALAKSELLRAIEFAKSAINRSAGAKLREMALAIGIDPDSPIDTGIEEETE